MHFVSDIIAKIFQINLFDIGVLLTLSVIQKGIKFEYKKATILLRNNSCFLEKGFLGKAIFSMSSLKVLRLMYISSKSNSF